MTRLDENRAVAQLAQKLGVGVDDVEDLVVWGNHSPTMFPDLFNAKVNGEQRRRPGRHGLVRERVHPARRQARRRDHRGARRLVGGVGAPTPRSTTCATGSLGADGAALDGGAAPAASTASRRG